MTEFAPDWFSRPGDSLLSVARSRGMPLESIAEALDGGVETLKGLAAGTIAIDAATAAKLAGLFGTSEDFWLCRQRDYDDGLDRFLDRMEDGELVTWMTTVPDPSTGSVGKGRVGGRVEAVRHRAAFFGCCSLDQWASRYGTGDGVRYRTHLRYEDVSSATALWLRSGELEAQVTDVSSWDRDGLVESIAALRKATRVSNAGRAIALLRTVCAANGIAAVFTKAPPGCRASGASFVLPDGRRVLLVSNRYGWHDQFWFTVFHELGHLLLHEGTFVDEREAGTDPIEEEADAFAANCIVPFDRREEMLSLPHRYVDLIRFSKDIGIAAGSVVGQMQHAGIVEMDWLNKVRRRWTSDEVAEAFAQPL